MVKFCVNLFIGIMFWGSNGYAATPQNGYMHWEYSSNMSILFNNEGTNGELLNLINVDTDLSCKEIKDLIDNKIVKPAFQKMVMGLFVGICTEEKPHKGVVSLQVLLSSPHAERANDVIEMARYLEQQNLFGATIKFQPLVGIDDTKYFSLSKNNQRIYMTSLSNNYFDMFWDFMDFMNEDVLLVLNKNEKNILNHIQPFLTGSEFEDIKNTLPTSDTISFEHHFNFNLGNQITVPYLLKGIAISFDRSGG